MPEPPKQNTRYADHGTGMHEAKAGAQNQYSGVVAPHRARLWPEKLGRHEVCLAWDCATRRVILGPANLPKAEQEAWKAAQPDSCVVGVSDWLGELPSGVAWIEDLKTGWQRPDPASVQNLFYLFCWTRARGEDWGWASVCWWPRGGEPSRDGLWRQVTSLAFEALEDSMDVAWRAATGNMKHDPAWRPSPRPGMHCSWCPSATVCPRAYE
jgi:hypothetical protein